MSQNWFLPLYDLKGYLTWDPLGVMAGWKDLNNMEEDGVGKKVCGRMLAWKCKNIWYLIFDIFHSTQDCKLNSPKCFLTFIPNGFHIALCISWMSCLTENSKKIFQSNSKYLVCPLRWQHAHIEVPSLNILHEHAVSDHGKWSCRLPLCLPVSAPGLLGLNEQLIITGLSWSWQSLEDKQISTNGP